MKVAIVDDQEKFIAYEKKIITRICKKNNIGVSIEVFDSGESLLEYLKKETCDMVFLDIKMQDMNGFAVAERINKEGYNTEIVFVTNKDNLVYDSFAYRPFRFIRKSQLVEKLEDTIYAYLQKQKKEKNFIMIRVEKEMQKVLLRHIYYFESLGHLLTIRLTNGKEIKYRDKISGREEELKEKGFVRIHSGFLVNMEYIIGINSKAIRMENGDSLPISRIRFPEVKQAFQRFLRKEV